MFDYILDKFSNFFSKDKLTSTIIVCDGNSLTAGTDGYPSVLQSMVTTPVYNVGISGQTTSDMINNSADVDSYIKKTTGKKILVAWEIRNSMLKDYPATTSVQLMQQYCMLRKNAGYDIIIVVNVIPSAGGFGKYWQPNAAVWANNLLDQKWKSFANDLVDLRLVPELQNPNDEIYFLKDKTHLTAEGKKKVAEAVYNIVKKYI